MWRRLLGECLRSFDDLNEIWILVGYYLPLILERVILDFEDVCF